jgi:ankyrin repeat protein
MMDLNAKIEDVSQAAQLGDSTRLRELLEIQPTLVNTENKDGLTPLGYAAHYGHIETVKVLLEFGAETDILSHPKVSYIPSNTALHAALAGKRSLEVIQLLLDHNASPSIIDSNGYTSLHVAAFHDKNEAIIRLLFKHGAPLDIKNYEGKTALLIAIEQGNLKVADFLRQNGAKE